MPRPLGLAFAQGPALHAFCTELICCFYPGATWLFPAHHTSSCRRDATLLANCLPFRPFLFLSRCFHPVAAYLLTSHIRLTHGLVSYAGCCTSLLLFTRTRLIPPTTQRLLLFCFLVLGEILACCIWGYLLSFGSICYFDTPPTGIDSMGSMGTLAGQIHYLG